MPSLRFPAVHRLCLFLLLPGMGIALSACADDTAPPAAQVFAGHTVGPISGSKLSSTNQWDHENIPSNRLINGPFTLNKSWTTYILEEPLTTLPHLQDFSLLLPFDLYMVIGDGLTPDDPDWQAGSPKLLHRLDDGATIDIEVILIDSQGEETPLELSLRDSWVSFRKGGVSTPEGRLRQFSYNQRAAGLLYFPENARYTAIKLRSTADKVRVEHFLWHAPHYFSNPDKTWEDVAQQTRPHNTLNASSLNKNSQADHTVGPLSSTKKWRNVPFPHNLLPLAPTDRLIKGPVMLNKSWITFILEEPLTTLPYQHDLSLLFSYDRYEAVMNDGLTPDDPGYQSYDTFERIEDRVIIKNEVVLIDSQGRETPLESVTAGGGSGWITSTLGTFHTLSYDQPGDEVFYYPENARYTAIKIRSNVDKVRVEHFFWHAPYYPRNPKKTWDDVKERTKDQAESRKKIEVITIE